MRRMEHLESIGYEWVDSDYAENKEIYLTIKKEQEELGCKVLRLRSDTKGLIMYAIYRKR